MVYGSGFKLTQSQVDRSWNANARRERCKSRAAEGKKCRLVILVSASVLYGSRHMGRRDKERGEHARENKRGRKSSLY